MDWTLITQPPEPFEVVLFYVPKAEEDDRDRFTGYINHRGKCVIFGLIGSGQEKDFTERVTHWQPLPSPPNINIGRNTIMIAEERKEALLWCWENETDDEEWRDELTPEEQEMVNGWDTGYFEGIAHMCAGNTLNEK